MLAARQAWLDFGPATHFDLLHGRHSLAVGTATRYGEWKQYVYPHDQAKGALLELVRGGGDLYFTQNGLAQLHRSSSSVGALCACYVDLDAYAVGLQASPEELLDSILQAHPWLPMPTMLIGSGRGAYLEWAFTFPLGREHLPRWQAVTDTLIALLKPWGADSHCRDASRVLRLVGSTHSKTGNTVTGLQVGELIAFDTLERAVLAHAPQKRQLRLVVDNDATRPRVQRSAAQRAALLRPYELHQARMADYSMLAQLRGSPCLTDCRSRLLFAYAASAVWFCGTRLEVENELRDFAGRHFSEPSRYSLRRVSTVLDRMEQAQAGVTDNWNGQVVDRRYRLGNPYLLALLEVSPDEQRHLRTVIGSDERNRRRLEAARKAGVVSRDEYRGKASERRQKALELRERGFTQQAIAKALGVSQASVSGYLRPPGGLVNSPSLPTPAGPI